MRRLVEVVLGALPLDDRSRRALDETLADWAHESDTASGAGSRLWCDVRALAAVARTMAAITGREVVTWSSGAVMARAALWLLASYLLLEAARGQLWVVGNPARFVMGVASWVVVFLPVALFLALSLRVRSVRPPVLGSILASLLLMVLVAGWMAPIANQAYREAETRRVGLGSPPRGVSELTLPELIAGSGGEQAGRRQRELQRLSVMGALLVLCPAMILLAAQLGRLRRRRWIAAVAVPAGYVVLLRSGTLGFDMMSLWILPAATLLVAAWLAAHQRRLRTSETGLAAPE